MHILSCLTNNARITNKELAERVGLSASGCLERVRRLEERGVLKGSTVLVDPAAVGVGAQALIAVRLKQHTRKAVASFRGFASTLPEVTTTYHVTGDFDFFMHVAARDMDHLRDFCLDAITTRPEVASIETSVAFDVDARPGWPSLRSWSAEQPGTRRIS